MSTSGERTRPQQAARPSPAKRPGQAARPVPAAAPKPKKGAGVFSTGAPVKSHHDERVATAMATNALSRERFELTMRTVLVLLVMLGLSMAANVYFGTRQPAYVYYALSSEGAITPVQPLDSPIQSSEQVVRWASEAISSAYTLSFANYTQQLSDNRYLFTDSGWAGFEQALNQRRFLDTIIKNQLVSTAVPRGAPVIVSSGVGESGRYSWRVQMPLHVTYDSASGASVSDMTIEAIIQRVPESENPRGLAIGQIIER